MDAERGNVRFGPFTLAQADAATFEELAAKLKVDVEELGLVAVLDRLEINGGYDVWLSGDPSQNMKLFEKELS